MPVSSVDSIEQDRQGIAPVWHTCILIAVVVALAIGGMAATRSSSGSSTAVPSYLGAIALEWVLFVYVWWGIRLRQYPLAALINPGRVFWFKRDVAFGIGIWVFWYVVLSLVVLGLSAAHISNAGAHGTIFPHGPLQIVLWIIMAASSGFSEELAFRGYLLQQFSRWTGSTTVGIIAQAILFGIGHSYLGTRQVLLIIASGIILGIFAAWLRNLRPLMITHAWADVFGGILVHGLPYS